MKSHHAQIDAVVFDYGQVLSLPHDQPCVDQMARLTRLTRPEFDQGHYRKNRLAYDNDRLSSRAYWESVIADPDLLLGDELLAELIRIDVASWLQVDDRVIAWARMLKTANIPIAILSNMPGDVLTGLRNSWGDWINDFDVTIFSCEVGSVKPEPEIYQRLANDLGLNASRVLFIDDHEANVHGAIRAGLHAIHYKSFEALHLEIAGRFDLPTHGST